ncbi:hypothetical protein [[Clostridium] dakarense]|uniref:hypothetical protein n=1 Tax=Faecalimicrobium dakarense TaxID=1301100 RepID=UPI0004ACEDC2|nr:hypothetical protein [[Clostridium] dakarense]
MNNYNWNNAFPDTPKSFKNKVSDTLNNLPDQEENGEMGNRRIYKNGSLKKKVIIALASTFVLGTTAFAAGKLFSTVGSTSNIPTYTALPSVEQVNDDFGFNPKLVDKFENGYIFENGYTSNYEGLDEDGNSLGKTKALNFEYKKDKSRINLSMEKGMLGEIDEKSVLIDKYNDIDVYYHSYANKLVPGDYEMTEQDKKDEASGKYVFSFGSEDIEISKIQYLGWKQDGINYSFLAKDSELSQDELVKMTHQIINEK